MTDPKPTRRRFCPTPAWLIYGLLVVEGLLWLSERDRWFGFNERKGWTVLIAVAGIGVVLAAMLLWFVVALIFRSLLVLVVAVALPFSWLAVEMKKAREQFNAIKRITELGADVQYDWELIDDANRSQTPQPPVPQWLRKLLGIDVFANVASVGLCIQDRGYIDYLDYLARFPDITGVFLDRSSALTDDDLEHLSHLKRLKVLTLDDTKVTDAGLDRLTGFTELQQLDLRFTAVTKEGVMRLQSALPRCQINR